MSAIATGLEHIDAPNRNAGWVHKEAQRVRRLLLDALDRLVPPLAAQEEAELPDEWFLYPPF
jgi:hypothetical protein